MQFCENAGVNEGVAEELGVGMVGGGLKVGGLLLVVT